MPRCAAWAETCSISSDSVKKNILNHHFNECLPHRRKKRNDPNGTMSLIFFIFFKVFDQFFGADESPPETFFEKKNQS